MTLQEKIQKKAEEYRERGLASVFLESVNFALNNQWISVEDDLPCNHEDLMKNENYTKRVLVVLSWNEDPTHIHIDISDMSNVFGSYNVGFYWRCNGYYTVTHWREMPGLPI